VAWLSGIAPLEKSGFGPNSGGFDLVSGFAFFVEVAPVDIVYDRDGKVLYPWAAKGLKHALPSRI
jgi:hypothetical protein